MMIDQQTLITYVAILLWFVFIPGPAVLLTLARATSSGTRVGMATALGIAAALVSEGLLVAEDAESMKMRAAESSTGKKNSWN